MKRTRTRVLLSLAAAVIILIGIYALIHLILAGYPAEWTGFGEVEKQPGKEVEREAKTLWDWMNLLMVPLVLRGGALWFSREERKARREIGEKRAQTEREIATDRLRENALQKYLDRMIELLLKEDLRAPEKDEVRGIARARTLAVLRGLDEQRKAMLVQFLLESGLIDMTRAVVSLEGADLNGADLSGVDLGRADLSGANLGEADLSGANLSEAILGKADLSDANLSGANLNKANLVGANLVGANLSRANLIGANLSEAILGWADLSKANLSEADLSEAILGWADLSRANLSKADLSRANLRWAKVTDVQFASARSLNGTTMPDGTEHK